MAEKHPHILTIGKVEHLAESKKAAQQAASKHINIRKASAADVLALGTENILMEDCTAPQSSSVASNGSEPL